MRAQGLANSDAGRFGGKSDPFVLVRDLRTGKKLGKTRVKKDTLDPEFDGHVVCTTVALDKRFADMNQRVRLEVWDYDLIASNNDFLGQVTLARDDLLHSLDVVRRPLKKVRGGLIGKKVVDQDLVQGHLEFRCNVVGLVPVTIVSAQNLIEADTVGSTDAYCTLRWKGWHEQKLGRTKVKNNSLDPVWNHLCLVEVPLWLPVPGALHVELFDDDTFGKEAFSLLADKRVAPKALALADASVRQSITARRSSGEKPTSEVFGMSSEEASKHAKELSEKKENETNEEYTKWVAAKAEERKKSLKARKEKTKALKQGLDSTRSDVEAKLTAWRKAQAKASKALKKRANYTGDDAETITKLEDAVDAANKLRAETGVAATAATKRWKALKSARKVARGK